VAKLSLGVSSTLDYLRERGDIESLAQDNELSVRDYSGDEPDDLSLDGIDTSMEEGEGEGDIFDKATITSGDMFSYANIAGHGPLVGPHREVKKQKDRGRWKNQRRGTGKRVAESVDEEGFRQDEDSGTRSADSANKRGIAETARMQGLAEHDRGHDEEMALGRDARADNAEPDAAGDKGEPPGFMCPAPATPPRLGAHAPGAEAADALAPMAGEEDNELVLHVPHSDDSEAGPSPAPLPSGAAVPRAARGVRGRGRDVRPICTRRREMCVLFVRGAGRGGGDARRTRSLSALARAGARAGAVAEPDGPGAARRRPGDVPARGLRAQPPAQRHRRGLPGAVRAVRPRAEAVARDAPGRRRVRVRGAALARAGAPRGQRPHGQADAGLAPLRPRSAQRARSAPASDQTCPISMEGWTRRVHFVREGGGGLASASPAAQSSPAAASAARRTPRPRRAPRAAHTERGAGVELVWVSPPARRAACARVRV